MGDHDGLESVITIGWNTQIAGQNAVLVLGFALFVMLALPIMRHFKLID